MNHRVSDFSLFNSNILLLSHKNVTPEVPEEKGGGFFQISQSYSNQGGAGYALHIASPSPKFSDFPPALYT